MIILWYFFFFLLKKSSTYYFTIKRYYKLNHQKWIVSGQELMQFVTKKNQLL